MKPMEAEDPKQRMALTVKVFKDDLGKIRTGRAHPGLLDGVIVQCYGQRMALSQLASVTVSGPRILLVSPWDAGNFTLIEKAIRESDLGVNPAPEAGKIRVGIPELSTERRTELVKLVNREAEAARISLRNIRRDRMSSLKEMNRAGEISEDEQRRIAQDMEKLTEKNVAAIGKLAEEKAAELMSD